MYNYLITLHYAFLDLSDNAAMRMSKVLNSLARDLVARCGKDWGQTVNRSVSDSKPFIIPDIALVALVL